MAHANGVGVRFGCEQARPLVRPTAPSDALRPPWGAGAASAGTEPGRYVAAIMVTGVYAAQSSGRFPFAAARAIRGVYLASR